jgi:uncharacterized membrane protein
MTRSRLENCSDKVLAVAATLLVLGQHDPGQRHGLPRELIQQRPSYAAYAVSFAICMGSCHLDLTSSNEHGLRRH